jgi:hypothetical protein
MPTSATPMNLERAGQQAVRGAEQSVTASVEPFYRQGISQMQNLQAGKVLPVMPSEVAALQRNSAIDDAISRAAGDAEKKTQYDSLLALLQKN